MTAPSDSVPAAPDVQAQPARTRYDAFISYSHDADPRLASALQSALHRFAKPWYRLRSLKVFRDNASLSANPALWDSIVDALQASRTFVLLASPEAKESRWVAREAEWWREHKPGDQVLLVLIDGEIVWDEQADDFDWERTSAVPRTLAGAFAEEPRWIDLRWARAAGDLSLRNPQFRDAVAEVGAPLHGRPKDELVGEDVRQHRRALRLARGAVATLSILLLAAVASGLLALDQRNSARVERDRAEEQARIATSRLLASQALTDLDRVPDRSVLLALEAFRLEPTFEARSALVRAAQRTQRVPAILRPGGDVRSVEFSRDGRTLLTTDDEDLVRFWDVRTNNEVGEPLSCYCQTAERGAVLMPDGKRVIVISDPTSITFWEVKTRRLLRVITDGAGSLEGLAVSRDGRFLATYGYRRPVVVWDAVRMRPLGPLPGTGSDYTRDVGFSPDGSLLAVDDGVRGLELWSVSSRRSLAALAPAGSWIRPADFTRDGKRLAFVDDAGIHVRNLATGALLGRAIDVPAHVQDLAFDPTGRLLAVAREDGIVQIWDAQTGRAVGGALTGHEDFVNAVAFSPDGRTLASAGQDGTLRLWSVASQPLGSTVVPIGSVLAVDPTGQLVAVTSSAPAQLVRQRDWSPVWTLPGRGETRNAAFSPDGSLLALGDQSGVVTVWDVRSRRQVSPPLGERGGEGVNSIAISKDGRYLAASTDGGSAARGWLRIWRVGSWDLVDRLHDPGDTLIAFTPDAEIVTVGDSVELRRIERDKLTEPTTIADIQADDAALSPDGRTLATGAFVDTQVRILDLRAKRLDEPLSGHTEDVDSLAFSPDGRVLATASSFEGTIRLWDVRSGRALGTALRSDAGVPRDLAFTPDNRLVSTHGLSLELTFTPDGRLRPNLGVVVEWDPILWRGTLEQFHERLCPAAGRNLRPEEWARFLPGQPYRRTCPAE
jgi:WD40 repeat protein